jgi:hypothetical protein
VRQQGRETEDVEQVDGEPLLRAGQGHPASGSGEWQWIDKAPKVNLFEEGAGRERCVAVKREEVLVGELSPH